MPSVRAAHHHRYIPTIVPHNSPQTKKLGLHDEAARADALLADRHHLSSLDFEPLVGGDETEPGKCVPDAVLPVLRAFSDELLAAGVI